MLDRNLILENERVRLTPIVEEDFPDLMLLTNDPSLWTCFTHNLSAPEEFREWAKPALESQRLQFAVWDKKVNQLVGSTALGNYSPRDQRIEIGWTWLGRDFHS